MKSATVHLDGDGLRFAALTGSGHRMVIDSAEVDAGPRPTELVLAALAAYGHGRHLHPAQEAAVVGDYEVRAEGSQRTEHPTAFMELSVMHIVRGDVDPEALRRAIDLSATRYCSVGASLSSGAASIRTRVQRRVVGRIGNGRRSMRHRRHRDLEAVTRSQALSASPARSPS